MRGKTGFCEEGSSNWRLENGELIGSASWTDGAAGLLIPGGAGTEIDTLVDSFITISPENLSTANIGQLKNVSSKFFDRLAEVGFTSEKTGWPVGLVLDQGGSDNSPLYPWLNDVTAENAASASIGQAKHLFSWDLRAYAAYDSDSDTLPDWWEQYWFKMLTQTASDDTDQDGLTNYVEYMIGSAAISKDSSNSSSVLSAKVESSMADLVILLGDQVMEVKNTEGSALMRPHSYR